MANKLEKVMQSIDLLNQEDPNKVDIDGKSSSKELLYSRRMSNCLATFEPRASEQLAIAVHGQHIARWKIPRDSYPKKRVGYLKWRKDLGIYHGDQLATIMQAEGYCSEDIERVKTIVSKKGIKSDSEIQILEDVACLVFIEHYLEPFALAHEKVKIIDIIRKTWAKMSSRGHEVALQIPLSEPVKPLVSLALQ